MGGNMVRDFSKKAIEISVLMPFKNTENYLSQCLKSLEQQTFKQFELIAINDRSTDASEQILKNWISENNIPCTLLQGPGLGIAKALKIGLTQCRGRYIARMDSDDTCHPDRLKKQFWYLKKNPNTKLLGTSCKIINQNGHIIGRKKVPLSNKDIFRCIFFKNPFIHGSTFFCAKSCHSVGGYSGSPMYVEDYELWFRFLAKFKCENLKQELYNLRIHKGSDTYCNKKKYFIRAQKTREMAIEKKLIPKYYMIFFPFFQIRQYFVFLKSLLILKKY